MCGGIVLFVSVSSAVDLNLISLAGHYYLWKNGIHHRDISDSNLMYVRRNGKIVGKLGDFDLSTLNEEPSGTDRTGTLPFMAIGLLTRKALQGKVVHVYGFEAEAFFWVAVIDTASYDSGRRVYPAPYAHWAQQGPEVCRASKVDFLFLSSTEHQPTQSQLFIWSLFRPLIPLLQRCIEGLKNADHELDDNIHEEFMKIKKMGEEMWTRPMAAPMECAGKSL